MGTFPLLLFLPFSLTLEVNGGADSRMPSFPSRSLSRITNELEVVSLPSLISLNRSMMSSSTRGCDRLDDLGNLETGGEDAEDEVEERPPPPLPPLQCSGVSSTRVVDAKALDVDVLGILGVGLVMQFLSCLA